MDLRSGISKESKRHFVIDEDALIRIKGVLDKAAKQLDRRAQVVFHVAREDDRFYETYQLEDVISDPNIPGKRINLIRIEIREEVPDKESERDWIARVVFLAERKWGIKYRDTDEIHVDISTGDRNWALLLADELEPQIERTINRSRLPRWPLFGIGALLVYIFIRLYFSLKDKIPVESVEIIKPFGIALVLFAIPVSLWFFLRTLIGEKPSILAKMMGPETVFLWGEEEKRFREREQTRKNIFWGVIVAFVVSAMASIAVTIM